MRMFTTLLAALALVSAGRAGAADAPAAPRPHIILIVSDDQGYGDFSCHGNPVLKTPHLDRLHDEGVRFRQFQVSPTCAPTRSALFSGRHEFKNGVTHTIFERERMSLDTTTLAQVLKGAGYRTGVFGKWHLGDEDAYQPDRRGFDEVFIHGGGGIGQSYPGSCGDAPGNTYFSPAIKHNGTFVKTTGYCTDVFFGQAIRWMESAKQGPPFFCYLALNAPHAPLHVPEDYAARYAGRVAPEQAKFLGMVANLDDNVGRLLAQLTAWGIEKQTLIIYMNDNGGTAGVPVFSAGLRGRKGTAYQGGTRAASFWRWPGTLQPADVNALAAHLDVFPTLAELAGAALPEAVAQQVEGRSLVPLLRDPQAPWADRTLVTHVGRWEKGTPPRPYGACSIRDARFSLVREGKEWHLFDLAADPGERINVAADHPEVVARLSAAYDQWWADVQPRLVNEAAWQTAPAVNPFKAQYQQQSHAKE